jgi:hypothetical protein
MAVLDLPRPPRQTALAVMSTMACGRAAARRRRERGGAKARRGCQMHAPGARRKGTTKPLWGLTTTCTGAAAARFTWLLVRRRGGPAEHAR